MPGNSSSFNRLHCVACMGHHQRKRPLVRWSGCAVPAAPLLLPPVDASPLDCDAHMLPEARTDTLCSCNQAETYTSAYALTVLLVSVRVPAKLRIDHSCKFRIRHPPTLLHSAASARKDADADAGAHRSTHGRGKHTSCVFSSSCWRLLSSAAAAARCRLSVSTRLRSSCSLASFPAWKRQPS